MERQLPVLAEVLAQEQRWELPLLLVRQVAHQPEGQQVPKAALTEGPTFVLAKDSCDPGDDGETLGQKWEREIEGNEGYRGGDV